MIKTILLASDLGAYSAYSLAYVEQLARRFNAKIVILHVVAPVDALSSAVLKTRAPKAVANGQYPVADLLATIREQAFERLLADEFGVDFSDYLQDIVVRSGNPANTIVNYAHQHPVDMIVIGNCSHPESARPMLGSIANKVLQLAQVPVFLVPLNAHLLGDHAGRHLQPR